jgi:hypothetical protein
VDQLLVAAAVGAEGFRGAREVVVLLPPAERDVCRGGDGEVADAVGGMLVDGCGVGAVPDLLDGRAGAGDLPRPRAFVLRQVEPGEGTQGAVVLDVGVGDGKDDVVDLAARFLQRVGEVVDGGRAVGGVDRGATRGSACRALIPAASAA